MDIRTLHAFCVIAKLENMSKASQILNVSQSSLSKSLMSLENEIGFSLFTRNGKKLVLNTQGARFLESCDIALSELDNAIKDIELMSPGSDGVIKICMPEINSRMSACLTNFKKSYSKTEYVVCSFPDYPELPDINEYDMIIYPDEIKYSKFRGDAFSTEKYYMAVNTCSGLSACPAASDKLLEGLDYIFLKHGQQAEHSFHVCRTLGIHFRNAHYADSRQSHLQMISAGLGVGFVPESCLEMYRSAPSVCIIPLTDERFKRSLKICFKREKHLTENALAFKRYVMDYYCL